MIFFCVPLSSALFAHPRKQILALPIESGPFWVAERTQREESGTDCAHNRDKL